MGLNLPSMIALLVWAFLSFPWYYVVAGVFGFLTVGAFAAGAILTPILRSHDNIANLIRYRIFLDFLLLVGTLMLWWRYYPL